MSLKKPKEDSKKVSTVKEKLREKIYDLIYGSLYVSNKECYCDGDEACNTACYKVEGVSDLYDSLTKLLEENGVHLDKKV